jgi:hypothetical protein
MPHNQRSKIRRMPRSASSGSRNFSRSSHQVKDGKLKVMGAIFDARTGIVTRWSAEKPESVA